MFDDESLLKMYELYVVPWGIKVFFALLIFFIGQFIAKMVARLVSKVLSRTRLDKILIEFIRSLINALLMVFVIVAALDQLGVNTNSVIAVLGAAGLAIGLALQGSLQNFAAGFMLLIFRPFKAGDFVEAAGTSGNIDKIGIFSTTMHTGDNKQVIIPNGAIYSGNIINYSSLGTRRIDMVFSIGYGDDMKKARNIIADIIAADERILKEPEPLIAVGELGASSVNFYVRPWVKAGDFWPVRFALTEAIKQAFDDNGISIPFPQMDVHLNRLDQ
ncbi:mechanosensitive ion channel family protein [Cellvibrio japonicus]|uniref:Small-conductance mechanosensitive channel n=1 Tax=Cellvibrio japonicus (strain Ueda107) TaxID=498211 RepID=B3PB30_CELJU|nr:mechanosensitive ion channel domain-containing protein [Cellvibrio japonicus]ACE85734.1 small-conductance mechanosensitive channel [Cellvibrio japonicus Ueda107]QEI11623.1 mechanosensitive ion channel [Cellvibrio japonicus]QEI15197.1 mechanosensitive ion channel [Cellvibrio japonicus]QEI18777.1 mechanosensitive ion channel [Cellvibrio japonicus]